ncbi:DUF3784 domain-containing protein [Dethiobacter alkaliphilus]|uniref:DUF3784 domain-containing protein n=1 Tax=Dethiobacter alkaliphilus TaxID=427926 RepID=UPI0022264F67|nr:DUF3784 domain-containing protein [Dethiobacter alkaliphilus]MCW3491681.1 DUF3784 domain-containing protein [Dethiobacter alkaliphilus]
MIYAVPLLLILLGYLVKVKRWSWLIAGYNTSSKAEKEKYDEEALCRFVGNLLFVLGGLNLLTILGFERNITWLAWSSMVVFFVVVLVALIYANTGNRLKK